MRIISTTQIEEEKEYLIAGIICKGSTVLNFKLTSIKHFINENNIRLVIRNKNELIEV